MRTLCRALASGAAVIVLLLGAEAGVRVLDRAAERHAAPTSTQRRLEYVRAYVRQLPVADGVDRSWFEEAPPPLPRTPLAPELQAVAPLAQSMVEGSLLFKIWNRRFLQESICDGKPFFERFPGFAFSFEPVEPGAHPPYRFPADVTTPFGLVTNHFGFRGHAIAADKPPRTIRIAFVGASTTVGSHGQWFSYPELLEPWLNRWIATIAPGVHIDVINAGREGLTSTDIAAVVRQEVLPLEPDLIVYYEGANQFTFEGLLDPAVLSSAPPAALGEPWLPGGFALLRRIDIVARRIGRAGAEPGKPAYRLHWPAGIDESHPDPDAEGLPAGLTTITRDLEDIRTRTQAAGAQLAVSSFVWFARPGVALDSVNNAGILRMLNTKLWPATYTDIRRLADFQNRVFAAYAASRHLPLLDVARSYPQDSGFFSDAIHRTLDGDRLHAWIAFQQLVPVLRAAIVTGRLPQPDRAPYRAAPASPLVRSPLACDFGTLVRVPGAFPLDALKPTAQDGASSTGDRHRRFVTPPGLNAYAAELQVAPEVRARSGQGVVRWRMRVMSGRIAAGVLTPDRSKFVTYRTLDAGRSAATDLYLSVPRLDDVGWLLIANAAVKDGARSEFEVEAIDLLVPPDRGH